MSKRGSWPYVELSQGELTRENAENCLKATTEMFEALSKSKRMEFLGHLNEVCLLLETVKRTATK